MRFVLAIIVLLNVVGANAQDFDIESVVIKESVKWIDETPQNPEEYIGRILVVKDGKATVHYRALAVPVEVIDAPSIKKSTLITAKSNATIGFEGLVSIKATSDSVYEFQNVNTRTWSAKSREPAYVEAINKFRNDPTTSPLFSDTSVEAVLMCVGVVQKKIWYRSYKRQGFFGGGTYFVKLDGSTYSGSEEYEEVIKFGLLVRPINGYGVVLPPTIANSEEIRAVINNPAAIGQVNSVLKNASSIFKF